MQGRLPEDANRTVLNGGLINPQVQVAGTIDSSVPTEALHVFRNMSTPRSCDLGPVKQTVPLNKPHSFELR
jgi:hypothetical protein